MVWAMGFCGMGSMETCCATRQKRPATVGTCFMPFILFFSRSYFFSRWLKTFRGSSAAAARGKL